ncbi:MAG TPA: VWA domain-containing protein [Planctomycetota bacterium]|nr:VWA domain-containing protein [Planctomycetota bacterium]
MLTFRHPAFLALAPVAVLFVTAAALHGTRALSPARRAAAATVRALLLSLLAAALAGPSLTLRGERPRLTVFLLDFSESVPRRAEAAAAEGLRRAWAREAAPGRACALVGFAGRAAVLVPPSEEPLALDPDLLTPRAALERLAAASERGEAGPEAETKLRDLQDRLEALHPGTTDFAVAAATACALRRDGWDLRLVFVTDGRDPERPIAALDLPPGTLAVRLDDPARRDAAILRVEAPAAVRTGEPFDVRVTLEIPSEDPVLLTLTADDDPAPEARLEVRKPPGRHTVTLENVQRRRSLGTGLRKLTARVELPGDAEPRNNEHSAVVTVTGRPRVLLVEGSPAEGEALARLLRAQDIDLERETPSRLAARAGGFEEFVAVILAGVPREALSASAVRALEGYVSGSGGGLWFVGSPALQGPRGYAGSDLEKLLPVAFEETAAGAGTGPEPAPPSPPRPDPSSGTPQRVLAPSLAILFVVDKSGSMAGQSIALVKEAVLASAETLTPKDVVGVLAFDTRPRWILEFTEADRQAYVRERVLRLFADGGTHIYPALVEALRAFQSDPRARRCAVRHMVLLSDGDTAPADFETVTREIAEAGITVSTVCVGSSAKFDATLMSQIASWGRGRFLFTQTFRRVPQIFVQETRQVLAAVPRDDSPPPAPPPPASPPSTPPNPPPSGGDPRGSFPVAVRTPHEVLQGIDGNSLPPLAGLLPARAREGADVLLATPDGRPVLALRRLGLGKTAAWTSDLAGRWSAEWLAGPASGKLFAQLVRYLSSADPDLELAGRVRISSEGGQAILRVDPGAPGETLAAFDLPSRKPLPLAREADGGRTLRLALPPTGEIRGVLLRRADGKGLLVGALRPSDPETLPAEPDRDLFRRLEPLSWEELERRLPDARMAGDRVWNLAAAALLWAALLLPLDVGLRRWNNP